MLTASEGAGYQWLKDGVPLSGRTDQSYSAGEPGSYTVEVSYADGCGAMSKPFVLRAPAEPVITGLDHNICPQATVELSTGRFETYQWQVNGADIPGATTRTCAAEASGSYTVRITDAYGCTTVSLPLAVTVSFCANHEVSPSGAAVPLHLIKGTGPGEYRAHFQKIPAAEGYNLYEGSLGKFYSHGEGTGNQCGISVVDAGMGELEAAFKPDSENHYYLVTAFGNGFEGPSGFASDGSPIPMAQSTCLP
jgi:hypothetical protein